MPPTAFHYPTAEGDEIHERNADPQYQPIQPRAILHTFASAGLRIAAPPPAGCSAPTTLNPHQPTFGLSDTNPHPYETRRL
jgi:hypothetical protein